MKKYNKYLSIFSVGMAFSLLLSCSSDIEKVYVNADSELTLSGATSDIILRPENPRALSMTLYWDYDPYIMTSNPGVQAPVNASELTLQFSPAEDFQTTVEIPVDKEKNSVQLLSEELNSYLMRLNYPAGEFTPLFIRMKADLASNIGSNYSNVLSVAVQPYKISMNVGKVLAADRSETDKTLASKEENGIYTGFMGVASWYNWWFLEANNTLWGNNGETGVPFEASTADSHWNFWFPEESGCYFVTLNTLESWWSALHIDSLEIGGDINGSMDYNQKSNVWTFDVDKPAGTYSINISGKGGYYDRTTDTSKSGAIPKEIGFYNNGEGLEFGENKSGAIEISLPGGATTIVLDLNNPLEYTLGTGEAPEPPALYDEVLWLSGFDDGISGEWNFDLWLTSYDSENGKYAAVHLADSLWGWLLYTDTNWGGQMGTESSDPYSGNIVDGGSNIPAPAKGRYVIDVDLSNKKYQLNEVTEVWYSGLNDDWSLYPMTLKEGCIYEAEVEKKADTPWGVKILLRDDWSLWFGGADGVLRYGWDGFNGDNELPNGNYILSVDLSKCTYTYTAK